MKKYIVWSDKDGTVDCFYIYNTESMYVETFPSKYLMHMVRAKKSPNTIERAARALSYYMLYIDEKEMELTAVYEMDYAASRDRRLILGRLPGLPVHESCRYLSRIGFIARDYVRVAYR